MMSKNPMANHRSTMPFGAAGFLAVLLLLLVPSRDASIPAGEMDSLLSGLRGSGYARMANAIATSDILLDLMNVNSSSTIFAPPDNTLFTLDMSLPSSAYLSAIRSHVVLRRFSLFDLMGLSFSASADPIQTLLPGRSRFLHVASRYRFRPWGFVTSINGVELTVPGIYYGRHITVHGLHGSLPDLSRERYRSISGALPPTISPSPGIPPDQTISPHPDHPIPASLHLSTPTPSPAFNPQIKSADSRETSERTSPMINNGVLEATIA